MRATPEIKAATITVAAVVLIAIIALVVSDTNTLITILSGQVGPAGV